MGLTRRTFLRRLGAVGGYGAAFAGMNALGLLGAQASELPALPGDFGTGAHVIVIGAGIAGLVCAYELERAGFQVTVLEARDRPGGRVWTLRGGDEVVTRGESAQRCDFSPGLYFNAGAGRIPSIHTHLLDYCRALGVRLEVEINQSLSARILDGAGHPMQMREAVYDTRSRVAELLAKAIHQGALDTMLTAEDRERLLPFLQTYGDLGDDFQYHGSTQAGYQRSPGAAAQTAIPKTPRALHDLMQTPRLRETLYGDSIVMQATMMQPVGGMQEIANAFARALKLPVRYGCEIAGITNQSHSARVSFRERASGGTRAISADYLVSTIPLPLLREIDSNFSSDVKQAIARTVDLPATKVAFESPRFWERDQIYGGLGFSDPGAGLIWYPSSGLNTDTPAVLVAAYVSGSDGAAYAKQPLAEQIERARRSVAQMHPGHGEEMTRGLVVNWDKIPYSRGIMLDWWASTDRPQEDEKIDTPEFKRLNEAEGRVYFAGAQLSQLMGWQEGAILSAHRIVGLLAERLRAQAPRRTSAA